MIRPSIPNFSSFFIFLFAMTAVPSTLVDCTALGEVPTFGPWGVAVGSDGTVYLTDRQSNTVRAVGEPPRPPPHLRNAQLAPSPITTRCAALGSTEPRFHVPNIPHIWTVGLTIPTPRRSRGLYPGGLGHMSCVSGHQGWPLGAWCNGAIHSNACALFLAACKVGTRYMPAPPPPPRLITPSPTITALQIRSLATRKSPINLGIKKGGKREK